MKLIEPSPQQTQFTVLRDESPEQGEDSAHKAGRAHEQ